MSEHRQGPNAGPDREELISGDDAFIDALSRGEDPSDGTDELAGLLLGLRDELAAPMPPAPVIADHFASAGDDGKTTVFPAVASIDGREKSSGHNSGGPTSTPAPEPAPVGDLDRRRMRKTGKHSGWFGHGLIGAAAATLIIAGGGAMVHSAQPGDSLWGINQALFTDHAAVVELTATLEEADSRNAEGDVQGALKLLEQARAMAQEMNAKEQNNHPAPSQVVTTTTETVTVAPVPAEPKTVTVTPPAAPAPAVTQTVVVTHTPTPTLLPSAPNLAPGVRPTTSALKPPSFPQAPTATTSQSAPAPVSPSTEAAQVPVPAPVPSTQAQPTTPVEGTHISSPTPVESSTVDTPVPETTGSDDQAADSPQVAGGTDATEQAPARSTEH